MATPDLEWEVWYADGSRFTSAERTWDDLPPRGVLVVRVWWPDGSMTTSWGEAYYGHPATWKIEGRVDDVTFAAALMEAQAVLTPPSRR